MWDTVPWFVGGGAQHSPEVARLLAYASTSGAEGIVGIGDLKVTALDVPGAAVNIGPGAAVILNRSAGGSQQSYVARNATQDTVAISATGSGAGRSDLIVARVEDPFVAGTPWQNPADPTVGPYIYTRVITNVPAGTTDVASLNLGFSAIALARIDLPASTATVTQSMVKDLRKMAAPRSKRVLHALNLSDLEKQTATGAEGEVWPNAASWADEVPAWATKAAVIATWAQVVIPPGNAAGLLWARLGYPKPALGVETARVGYDTPGQTQYARGTFVAADTIAIPPELRGTTQAFHLRAQNTSGADSNRLYVNGGSAVTLDIEFTEAPA